MMKAQFRTDLRNSEVHFQLNSQPRSILLMNIKVVDYISKCALQLCPTLCDPMDCSLPVSSVHGILHARIPEWIAMPSSREQIFLTQGLNPCLRHLLHWQVGSFPQVPPGEPFILLQMTEIIPPYT